MVQIAPFVFLQLEDGKCNSSLECSSRKRLERNKLPTFESFYSCHSWKEEGGAGILALSAFPALGYVATGYLLKWRNELVNFDNDSN